MSDQEMAHRIKDILLTKAALGMGEGDYGGDYGGEIEDVESIYGRGGARKRRTGSKTKRKSKTGVSSHNPWIKFVKKYARAHGMTYGEALASKRTCVAYRRDQGYTRSRLPCKREPVRRRKGSKRSK
jgi:hypothetical protein